MCCLSREHYLRTGLLRRTNSTRSINSDQRLRTKEALLNQYGKCLACGSEENLTLDHIIPRARGGPNNRNNLQLLCRPCNEAKGNRTIDYRSGLRSEEHTSELQSQSNLV